jgi:hypothetical protein
MEGHQLHVISFFHTTIISLLLSDASDPLRYFLHRSRLFRHSVVYPTVAAIRVVQVFESRVLRRVFASIDFLFRFFFSGHFVDYRGFPWFGGVHT